MQKTLRTSLVAAVLAAMSWAGPAMAGPYIIAGTDADDHGSVSGGVNQDGWFFMQRALENIAPGVTNGNKSVVFLGTNPGSFAGDAASSAFGLSALAGLGWTSTFVNGVTDITNFFASGISSAGIIMMDSGGNVSGGISDAEEAVVTANATTINNFLGTGGGLFTQANSLGFLTSLIPGIVISTFQDQGLALTAAGNAAFPGLTNADLSSGPYHAQFTNTGVVPVLAREDSLRGLAVILGASGGTITDPDPPTAVPVPASLGILGLGIAGLFAFGRRRA
ncbi:MAG: hypothetical protein K2X11_18800 [Acetobacteraceae bacterium]|nr:hypothetical protein [Acetobacteraceae bacterium]